MNQRKDDSRIEVLLGKADILIYIACLSGVAFLGFCGYVFNSLSSLNTNVAVINTKLEAIVATAEEARKDIQQLQGKVFKENMAKKDD